MPIVPVAIATTWCWAICRVTFSFRFILVFRIQSEIMTGKLETSEVWESKTERIREKKCQKVWSQWTQFVSLCRMNRSRIDINGWIRWWMDGYLLLEGPSFSQLSLTVVFKTSQRDLYLSSYERIKHINWTNYPFIYQ